MNQALDHIRTRFIEESGRTTQALGHGRTLGQIFGVLYLSPDPLTLDQLTEDLEISKGGASMAVRQLEQWGAVRRIWIKGERKDFLEAQDDFGRMVRKALLDTAADRMHSAGELLDQAEEALRNTRPDREEDQALLSFYRKRFKTLSIFRDRARWIWDRSLVRLLTRRSKTKREKQPVSEGFLD